MAKYTDWTMGQTEALINKSGGIEVALRMLRQKFEVVFTSIVNWLGNITLSATTEKFVAASKFVVNTTDATKPKISYLDDDFENWFLGKTEDQIAEASLWYGVLTESANSQRIIAELGGGAKAETTLTEMFSLMEKQKNGESRTLLNNGWANIFYIKDSSGVLRTVFMAWYDGGWHINARSVGIPHAWGVGYRVFSRNPLESSETPDPAQA